MPVPAGRDWNALVEASRRGYAEVVDALCDVPSLRLDVTNSIGETPLLAAVRSGHARVVATLASRKADVNHRANNGSTALMIAAEEGHVEVAAYLLHSKARVNDMDEKGGTAMLYASTVRRGSHFCSMAGICRVTLVKALSMRGTRGGSLPPWVCSWTRVCLRSSPSLSPSLSLSLTGTSVVQRGHSEIYRICAHAAREHGAGAVFSEWGASTDLVLRQRLQDQREAAAEASEARQRRRRRRQGGGGGVAAAVPSQSSSSRGVGGGGYGSWGSGLPGDSHAGSGGHHQRLAAAGERGSLISQDSWRSYSPEQASGRGPSPSRRGGGGGGGGSPHRGARRGPSRASSRFSSRAATPTLPSITDPAEPHGTLPPPTRDASAPSPPDQLLFDRGATPALLKCDGETMYEAMSDNQAGGDAFQQAKRSVFIQCFGQPPRPASVEPPRPWVCTLCPRGPEQPAFVTRAQLEKHQEKAHPFQCPTCGERFDADEARRVHMR
jgi:hypothetical protein